MSYDRIEAAASAAGLTIVGAFHPESGGTLVLLGPNEPAFWEAFKTSREYTDGQDDPLDRWSKRMIDPIAIQFAADAVYPSDGPPYPAFLQWAIDSGRCWSSPVHLLVHDKAGLFLSFRGALRLSEHIEIPQTTGRSPCSHCSGPCITACPVGAFASGQYDVKACKTHIETSAGNDCYQGCKVRLACPVSQAYGRLTEQSEFHMKAFHPK
ncbi:MAG: ferredoxin [Paracoccaceae bacterium]|nr:ferredoxin [Paracoccaceae bacterium]MDG1736838.1 ferredoxin [Paracoccaceae bacterium]MDG2260492.1 ferredoxin [Paracoccaceae bacterium]